MSRLDEIYSAAQDAYQCGRFREALLHFRQAAHEAARLGDKQTWFRNLVWAGSSASLAGDYPLAMRLFFEARADEPIDRADNEAGMARKLTLDTLLDFRPELPRVMEHLRQLQEFAKGHPFQRADMECLVGQVAFRQGKFTQALESFERAWQVRRSGSGYIAEWYAKHAILCCLAQGDAKAARDWICALERVVSAFVSERRTYATAYRLSLSFLEAAPLEELKSRLRAFEDAFAGYDSPEWSDTRQSFRVRVHLLDPADGDPAKRPHRARQALICRLASRWDVHVRFERRLLFLDYRLAALRYAAGVPPVDDLFYARPQEVPARISAVAAEDDLALRLQKARAAMEWARAYARKLDGWLECHWRQEKVEARRERIEEIARAWRE